MGIEGMFGLSEIPPERRDFGIESRDDELIIIDQGPTIRLLVARGPESTLISIDREYADRFGHTLRNLSAGENHAWRIIQNMAPFIQKMSIVRK